MDRIYLDNNTSIRRYFYPAKCQKIQGIPRLGFTEDLYITPQGTFILHTYAENFEKWHEIDEEDARYWAYKNNVNIEIEV